MPSSVIQIDHKCNNTFKCYPNRVNSKERHSQYKMDKIKCRGALSKNTIYILLHNRKSTSPNINLACFKSKGNKRRGSFEK